MILWIWAAAGLEWADLIFVAGALAFVFRDELRAKWATGRELDIHERVRALELRWEGAAEMHHIQEINARIDALSKKPRARAR